MILYYFVLPLNKNISNESCILVLFQVSLMYSIIVQNSEEKGNLRKINL